MRCGVSSGVRLAIGTCGGTPGAWLRRPLAVLFLSLSSWALAARALPPHAEDAVSAGVVPDLLPGVPPFVWDREAATATGASVLLRLRAVSLATRESRYEHRTHVDESRGMYHWDCSGMTGWVLEREAPVVLRAAGGGRPLARDFARAITAAPTDRYRHGLRRIDRAADVRPGDLFAWERPRGMAATHTGHVGVVVGAPVAVLGARPAVSMRIADSTTLWHDADTRAVSLDRDGGLGEGTMTFLLDDEGRAAAYGWLGTLSPVYVATPVVFGRLE